MSCCTKSCMGMKRENKNQEAWTGFGSVAEGTDRSCCLSYLAEWKTLWQVCVCVSPLFEKVLSTQTASEQR